VSWLSTFCVDRRLVVVVTTLLLAAVALVPALRLSLDALPDLTNNQVVVLTTASGLSPEEVEVSVSRPLEIALSGLPGLGELRSLSRYGISSLTAVFEDDVDPWRARQMVTERLQGVSLPEGVAAPELAPLTGGLGEIFHVTLSSPERSPSELLELATLRVAPLLKSVQGVVEVNSWGGAQRTLDVVAQPALLAAHRLSLDDVRLALEEGSGARAGGALEAGEGQVLLRAQVRPRGLAELGSLVVGGTTLRAEDLAELREGSAPRLGAATENGRGETVYLMAQMLRDENALEVLDGIHATLPAVRASLPRDVELRVLYDRSVLVGGTLETVAKNLLEGGLLVVGVLLAFLGSLRAGLVVASVIPLSMVFATAIMSLAGLPGNLMSLGALDFGLLVDGAIVLVEGVFHAGPRPELPFREHVRIIARTTARPVFFSVLVILLVYVPVLSLSGTDGKLFRPMALTVVLALGCALLLSLTWVPALLAMTLRAEHVPHTQPLLVRLVERLYPLLLSRSVRRPLPVLLATVAVWAVGGYVASTRGVEFTPQLDEGDLVIQTTRAPDISLARSVHDAMVLERALLEHVPEVARVVSRVGSPAVATDIMGLEQADVFVKLVPREQYRGGMDRETLIAELARVLEEHAPGSDPAFTQPIQMRFNELLGGAVTDVAVSVYGEDLAVLRRLSDAIVELVRDVPGAVDVRVLAPPSVPISTVRPRPLDSVQVGLHTDDVLDAVQALRMGIPVGHTYQGPLRVPLRLLLDGPSEASELANASLPVASGAVVPLSSVADVELGEAPGMVNRRNGQRRLVVGFNVRGADLGSVVREAQARVARELPAADGVRVEWGGQYESLNHAAARLALIVPVVLCLILLVLTVTFRGLRPAMFVFSVVPVSAVGGVLALYVRDLPISLPAAIGFIALSGIAVMNGVVWMSRALELEAELPGRPAEIAQRAALERARPVLMTALVAALGFVPMMLSRGIGAEVQRPLATVVVGGLVTSTLLTLVVLPALYPFTRRRRALP
jgi:cobalt-zinc-cadmium resistance protein CzcA